MLRLFLAVLLLTGLAAGQSAQPQVQTETLNAEAIMARVAANQDRSESLRKEYVYQQHIHIVTHKPSSRMMREETADYEVVPLADGIQKHLKLLTGRYWNKNKYLEFQGDPAPRNGSSPDPDLMYTLRNHNPLPLTASTDAELIHYLRNYLLDDMSKDGVARALFPLTFDVQKDYVFQFLGEEAFIDAAEFQPVRVFTKLSGHIPLLVRTMWFDLPGLGFNVVYRRREDGVWFPSSFGTEFRVHTGPVFFNRDVSISMKNSGFEHRQVESK